MSIGKKILKSLSWRVHASTATVVISYIFTGKLKIAGAIAVVLMIIKFIMFLYHEKLWDDWIPEKFDLEE